MGNDSIVLKFREYGLVFETNVNYHKIKSSTWKKF